MDHYPAMVDLRQILVAKICYVQCYMIEDKWNI